jgi:hypothetical protein
MYSLTMARAHPYRGFFWQSVLISVVTLAHHHSHFAPAGIRTMVCLYGIIARTVSLSLHQCALPSALPLSCRRLPRPALPQNRHARHQCHLFLRGYLNAVLPAVAANTPAARAGLLPGGGPVRQLHWRQPGGVQQQGEADAGGCLLAAETVFGTCVA